MPWVSGKCFFSSRTSSSVSPIAPRAPEPAGLARDGLPGTASVEGADVDRDDAAVAPDSLGCDTEDLLAVGARRLTARADQPQRRDVGRALAPGRGRGAQPA